MAKSETHTMAGWVRRSSPRSKSMYSSTTGRPSLQHFAPQERPHEHGVGPNVKHSRHLGLFDGEHYPVADRLSRQGLYLPSGPDVRGGQVDVVARALAELLT